VGDIVKPATENPLAAIKDREERLLTRVESFTSKDVSEACRGMNEKILERVALMCERIGGSGENLSNAVLTVVNLSKHKDSKEETLNSIMEKLETSADSWFLHNAERLSQKVSPEQFLKSIPLLERISNWNKRAFTPSVMIDESKMILLTSEFLNSVGDDRVAQCVELGKECAERLIKPSDLYKALMSIAKKNPTQEEFNRIFEEFSKLIPVLKTEYEVATKFFLDEPGDEKVFYYKKPEWTLSSIADKAAVFSLNDFVMYLTKIRREEDPFLSMIAPKENESVLMQNFKKELELGITWHAGAMAFALVLSENPEAYKLIENAFSERKGKGYYHDMFEYSELLDPVKILNEFLSTEKKPLIPYHPPERKFSELMQKSEITYINLKRIAESSPEVMKECSALNILLTEYRDKFAKRISVLTSHEDIHAEELKTFIKNFLEISKEKHLFDDRFKFADIGTASGEFSGEFVSYVRSNFQNPIIIRTNPTEFEIKHHSDLEVTIHDITQNPLNMKANVVIVKDMMKFFEEDGRGRIWNNVTQSVSEGGIVISGSTVQPQGYAYKQHVMHKGELVRVDSDKFLNELRSVGGYQDYLNKLDSIVEISRIRVPE
jgi:hypothetical protein